MRGSFCTAGVALCICFCAPSMTGGMNGDPKHEAERRDARTAAETARDRLLGVALGEVGVREATGRNDGPRVEDYLRSVGLGKGEPWCAAFVYWAHRAADIEAVRSGYSPDWFRRNLVEKGRATGGDVFGVWFSSKKRIAHVGLIERLERGGKWVITVEGNTNDAGSREGDGVYRKRRPIRQIHSVSRFWDNVNGIR